MRCARSSVAAITGGPRVAAAMLAMAEEQHTANPLAASVCLPLDPSSRRALQEDVAERHGLTLDGPVGPGTEGETL